MTEWIVRVEAVNFGATILDTNDLSTIRGGGLACLHVAEPVGEALARLSTTPPENLFSGASQCAFRIETQTDEATTAAAVERRVRECMRAADGAKRTAPHAYMMHVVDIARVAEPGTAKSIEEALAIAEARNRARQLRQWTQIPIAFSQRAKDADRIDGVSPATVGAYFPKGKVLISEDDRIDTVQSDSDLVPVSPSVKARRDYGRTARQGFYRHFLGDRLNSTLRGNPPMLRFSQSFQDIVADPPREAGLSARSKIAVVYADGNGFGKARDSVGTIEFSKQMERPRAELLKAATDWLAAGALGTADRTFAVEDRYRGQRVLGLRFETILWGGDEMAFVMPAWLAMTFVEGFFRHTADWKIVKQQTNSHLTHAVGVAIGHVKTPIRQLRDIAKAAADAAKEAGLREVNSVTFEIFESLHPPDRDLARWRKSVFGEHVEGANLALRLALPGDNFANVIDRLEALARGKMEETGFRSAFPRSQIYSALRELRQQGRGVGESGADRVVEDAIDTYAGRAGMDRGLGKRDLTLPAMNGRDRGLAMNVALIATLWDYASPFKERLPRFAAAAGP